MNMIDCPQIASTFEPIEFSRFANAILEIERISNTRSHIGIGEFDPLISILNVG